MRISLNLKKSWRSAAVLLFFIVVVCGPILLAAFGIAAIPLGYSAPAWPWVVAGMSSVLLLAWGAFSVGVIVFTGLVRWIHSRPVHRFAEWWLPFSENEQIWMAFKFLVVSVGILVGIVVFSWLIERGARFVN